ncbi:MAG TPA: SDR family oxidoreductase [Methylococcaceae bacterium]|jgi:NAD(P)-dependent dehydrogenase (short-subunit alcohol dehydrogenase family)|nr:SDR family oxidoreductase [Methylococcaceae bacterium]
MPSILITGSNRGLGLEWSRQYALAGWRVYATCRHPEEADELRQLAHNHNGVSILRLDVTRDDQIGALANDLQNQPIDILVNNAGVYHEKYVPLDSAIDYEAWVHTYQVNTMAALRTTKALLGNLLRGERRLVVAISSHMGSIAEIDSPGSYFYRSSKAALNAVMRGLSLELRLLNIGVLILHPGWVKTRMGGPDAPLPAEDSVRGMRTVIDGFILANTGRFFRYNGTEIPW